MAVVDVTGRSLSGEATGGLAVAIHGRALDGSDADRSILLPATGLDPGLQTAEASALVASGVPADRLVLEVALEPTVDVVVEGLRAAGWRAAVGVWGLDAADATTAQVGAGLGLLTAALIAGVEVVRTDSPRAVRRVVAVVDALRAATADGARMAP